MTCVALTRNEECEVCGEKHDVVVGSITLGPNVEIAQKPDRVRWCFRCRKHLPHTWVCLMDEPPGYYDPIWVLHCKQCRSDYTDFPGTRW